MRRFVTLASMLALFTLSVAQGAPQDVGSADGRASNDGEVIAMVIALNEGEIRAATEAGKKKIDPAVADYARMLHTEHDKNLRETRDLSKSLGIGPLETQDVARQRDKAHEAALALIDNDLSKAATQDALKRHLTATRGHIAMHLDRARSLQGAAPNPQPR